MAGFGSASAKMTFRMDSGESRGGKTVYRNMTISSVNAAIGGDDAGACARTIKDLVELGVDKVTYSRVCDVDMED